MKGAGIISRPGSGGAEQDRPRLLSHNSPSPTPPAAPSHCDLFKLLASLLATVHTWGQRWPTCKPHFSLGFDSRHPGEGGGYLERHLREPCLLLCTTDSRYFKTESEPLPLWRSPARPPGAAWSPVVSLPGCQGSPCWASWEHTACRKSIPFRSCSLCQGSTVPTKAPRGRPREGNEQQKPRSLADIHCPELSVTAC